MKRATMSSIIIVNFTFFVNNEEIGFGTMPILCLTLYNPGGGGFKSPPPPIFCSHAFNFGAALLCVGDFSQKIV